MIIGNRKVVATLLYSASALLVSLLQKCLSTPVTSSLRFLWPVLWRGENSLLGSWTLVASGHWVRLGGMNWWQHRVINSDSEQWLHDFRAPPSHTVRATNVPWGGQVAIHLSVHPGRSLHNPSANIVRYWPCLGSPHPGLNSMVLFIQSWAGDCSPSTLMVFEDVNWVL